ncbi:GNAT family N-acetyltransferase [Microlunatus sp. GCM10028923]|uniref:GNAT family N-acetyltransferase n=1 Tax=Microlunatus sp. GCM10028923 TaxID=3273400 RepID=UPI00361AF8DE
MDVTLRPRQDTDLVDLLRIWRAAVEATHLFLTHADIDGFSGLVADYLPRMNDLRVAVDAANGPLGFIAQVDGKIEMLFVDPAAHGRGIGTLLLEDVGRDFATLRLDVNEQNPTARRFYAAKGFVQVGRSPLDHQGLPFPLLHLERRKPLSP